jgi:hypothetical protein
LLEEGEEEDVDEEESGAGLGCLVIPADFISSEIEWIGEFPPDAVFEVEESSVEAPDRRPFVLVHEPVSEVDRTEQSAVSRWEVVVARRGDRDD